VTIYDGFDAEAFLRQPVTPDPEFRTRYGIPREIPLVATVGGIQRRKGLIDVVEAAALLRERHRIVVLFAGAESDPEFAAQLSARIAALGLEGSFRFLGYQSNVHDVLARCEMLVHPAHSEGLGIVLMEAMAAGKPIVATRSGGPEEVVVEGETGLLVPPGEPRLLANAMDTLLSDPSTATAMGRAGRARLRGFSPEDTARQTQNLYDELGAASSTEKANRRRVAAELPDEILGRARRAVAEARS
jgi:starch synthase